MTKHQIEVITSVERRRRWAREEKEQLVAATLEPGAKCFGYRAIGGHPCEPAFPLAQRTLPDIGAISPQFMPVKVVASLPEPEAAETNSPPLLRKKTSIVMIELGRGRRIRVESDIDTEALGRILDVVRRR